MTEKELRSKMAENERLQVENERMAHLLSLATEQLQRQTDKSHAASKLTPLRDPFRSDHPARER